MTTKTTIDNYMDPTAEDDAPGDDEELPGVSIARWVSAYRRGCWDGDETPNDMAAEFFNSCADVDDNGTIWLGGLGTWVGQDRLYEFVTWLQGRNAI